MSQQQLCLFKFERPFVDRFGAAFFGAVPRKPGIYIFIGLRGRVLYVGQSRNLRVRLSYYKNARPEREPRKIIRLINETRRIEVLRCETAEAAQLREVELIRAKRPRFNTALTSSRAYSFFGLSESSPHLVLRISLNRVQRDGEQFYGAFKNRGLCRRAFLSLGRVIWAEMARPASVYDLPLWLHERSRATEWQLPPADGMVGKEVEAILSGDATSILVRVEKIASVCRDPFLRKLYECDLLTLGEFGVLAQRMKVLRVFSGSDGVLPQEAVDPVQLRHRFSIRVQG